MRFWKFFALLLAPTLCLAAQPDRITGPLDSAQRVSLRGNVHGLAQARFDQGRTDGSKVIHGVTLAFRLSAAQQKDLDNLLARQQDHSSSNYHKWLTPAQFADRFGMSQNDMNRVTAWLESHGFTVASVANARNQISFDGTVAQIESVFDTEIHDYVVNGEIHFANASNPSVPAAMAGSVLAMGHLHNFQPKPRAISRRVPSNPSANQPDPEFTSHLSGSHFLAPGDFATIYDVQTLYNNGTDGTGQKIALTGQSSISLTDVANFRSAAGLSANVPTLLLEPGTGTSTRCSGDEGESDLDVEWSGAVAKNASITLVYVGLLSGETCGSNTRQFGAFDALHYAIDQNIAPVISNSYGNCEANVDSANALAMQGWIKQANTQGQTVVSSSGDDGAADCDFQVASATQGFAVDIPAAIPEVTGMGGTEFTGDAGTCTNLTCSGDAPADPPYWAGTTGGTDTISSALIYIPEMGWNDSTADIAAGGNISASGGGASLFFSKPSWQTGAGVPIDGKRDVPDLALNASADHDGYLFCSEDGATVPSCSSGFRDSTTHLTVVGGTSAAAPTFAGIVALLSQYLVANGFQSTPGLGNANPQLYHIATYNPSAMNDVTTGNNIVPCTTGSTNCPAAAPFRFGFNAGVGYDQVTGLGSVNANALAVAWGELATASTTTLAASATSISVGNSVTFTATVTPSSATGTVSFYNNGSNAPLGTGTVSGGTATFTTTSLPSGTNSITATYNGSNASSTSAALTVTVIAPFSISASPSTLSVIAGQTAAATITVTPINNFTGTVNFTNSTTSSPGSCTTNLPAGAKCSFNPPSVTLDGVHTAMVTLTISTAANMALPSGSQAITVTGTSGSTAVPATVNLTVTSTNQSFTLSTTAATFPVAVGGSAAVSITVNGVNGFVTGSGAGATTSVPLTYSCSGVPSLAAAEISCQLPNNGQPDSAPAVTISLVTTPVTTRLVRPTLGRGPGVFYAFLLPGLFGVVFATGSRNGAARLFGLLMVLGLFTVWMGACGGSSSNTNLKNPGTPPGAYAVTINATTGGANPISSSLQITLNVTQ
jgi:subtilase family serine protease